MSDEQTTKRQRKTEAEPLPIQATPRRNDVLARRLAGNPNGSAQRDIPLKEPHRWQLYIANDYNQEDDLYRMVHELGWSHLLPEDLACKPKEIGFRVSEDGHLVRGTQGREMVFKMAKDDYRLLKQRESDANNAQIGRPGKTKEAAANAVASVYGDEAASFVDKHLVGSVTDTQEPLPGA